MSASSTIHPHTTCRPTSGRASLDYSALLQRHDPAFPPLALGRLLASSVPADTEDLSSSDDVITLGADQAKILMIVVRHWLGYDIPTGAVEIMGGVLAGLLARLQTGEEPRFWEAGADTLGNFVTEAGRADCFDAVGHIHLRRNTINAALLSLKCLHVIDGRTPLVGLPRVERALRRRQADPTRPRTRRTYANRSHLVPATHDEVLLTRLASELVRGSRSIHRCAAAVALATSTACVTEIAQVTWIHHGEHHVILLGRASADGNQEKSIRPRTTPLDSWSRSALAAWHRESREAYGYSHNKTIFYAGDRDTTSSSAHASVSAQVRKAITLAGLRDIPGLQPDSLRLWAATKNASSKQTALDAADMAGLDIATLHRIVHHLGERALSVA